MERLDCVVIGAGVVGLAIAREMALQGKETILLEREPAFGTISSARNSEVIHAGIYYPKNSLKARFASPATACSTNIAAATRWVPSNTAN
jgi:L-2-hydroxyglutarate oxidase LhgO